VARQATDHCRRRLRHRRKLHADLGQRDPRADVGDRPQFNGLDQAFEHIVEQRDLLVIILACGNQEEVGYAPCGLEAFLLGPYADGRFDFFGDGQMIGSRHRSS
jgi:hypothetical protein